jgi:hypothetical protein
VNDQLQLNFTLEISASVLRHHLERTVAQIDVPLVVPGMLPINLGRLAGGRIDGFAIDANAVSVALSFERGRKMPVRIEVQLTDVRFDSDTQALTLHLERLNVSGLTLLSALVNPLRGQLVKGAVRAANQRVPGLLSAKKDQRLELHVKALTAHMLTEAGSSLKTALEPLLPVPANARVRVLSVELTTASLGLSVQVAV